MNSLCLSDHLALVKDPRSNQGKRHSLPAILNLVVVGLLCGMRSLHGISQFGRSLRRDQLKVLGFVRHRPPAKGTLSTLLRDIDMDDLRSRVDGWSRLRLRSKDQIALDGKTLRGSADGEVPALHLLAAYAVHAGITVGQVPVPASTNEHKTSLDVLAALPLQDKVLTADAMFTHRDFCEIVLDRGGDYLLIAKENQPALKRDIAAVFAPQPGLSPPTASVG